ncbi:ubiquitin carboxyl-terminal hydrolase 16 isoform X2 [Humulus lupulus]|uniref:ubiquitin carboxyl-terminal hydrolase 16 isoform X2 n=1 Tax=Humulus lupulus TaxID=3486 RepID=UPI002B416201|nr:ubiquitin carboxyl-terminal hydrolase 16 isoform X2 [Humulus lupulus]
MLVVVGLGFQSLVLLVCFVVPVIGFFLRRKWKLSVSRAEEIRRLVLLASEEAARAEFEANAEYGYSVVSTVSLNQCAVCYFPTTTRCAQCKAVRYCSGKCQIIHWRQGHKEECHPPCPTQTNSDVGSDSDQKLSKEEYAEVYGDNSEGTEQDKPIKTFSSEPSHPSHAFSPEVPHEKDDGSESESLDSEKGTNSISESCSTSFSGFSTSTTGSEMADDVSVSESISSTESDKSDGHLSVNGDTLHTAFSVKDANPSEPLSPKFARLANSINGFTASEIMSETKSRCSDGEQGQPTCPPLLRNTGCHDGPTVESCESSSGFWERALDSVSSSDNVHDEIDDTSDSTGHGGSRVSTGSSIQFSLNTSRNTSPLCMEGSVKRFTTFEDPLSDTLLIKKALNRSDLSENTDSHVSKVKDCGSSKNRDDESRYISSDFKLGEVKSVSHSNERASRCTNSSNVIFTSTKTQKLDHVVNDNKNTLNLLKSRDRDSLSSFCLLSSNQDSTISRSKAEVDFVQDDATVSYQISSPPNVRNGLKTSVQKVVEQFKGSKLSKQNPLGFGGEIAGRYSGIFPYESFVKLYNWNKMELRPCGLKNCGNSCYVNAVLQCLAFTPPLTAYFLQGLHSKACIKKEWCFTCEFESLILKAKEGKSPLSPIGILSKIQNIGSQLGSGREEDAHEFLRYVIDTMQSVCLAEPEISASGPLEEKTTLVGLTFGGYLRSKIKCMKCQGKSERQEGMMDLTVEIEGDIGTLEEALRKFTSTETLDGENKYQCSRCKSYEKAKKKLTILEAPNVLTIALKRFQSGKFGKLNKPIRFQEILNLAPFMSGTSDKLAIYRLYGVVVHLDVMNASFAGHYVCYVKNAQNKWFKVDDSLVTAVELEKVLSKGAYMLFYARCSPRAPRSIRNKIVSPDLKARAMPSWIGGRTTTFKSKSTTISSIAQVLPNSSAPDGSANYDSFYSKFHRLQRILEEDSSSDNSSLISNNSDEGSCSTDSTRDSTSTDEFSDYIFGESGRGSNSPWRNSPDSDTSSSSSSSPLYSKHSRLSDLDRYDSVVPETRGHQSGCADDGVWNEKSNGSGRGVGLEREGTVPFLRSDTNSQCRKLESSSSGSSSRPKTDIEKVESESSNGVKYDVSFRRSTGERTTNI